jgi:hypothetical protein
LQNGIEEEALELPRKTGDWAGGMPIEYRRDFMEQAKEMVELQSRIVKQLALFSAEGPAHSGLETRTSTKIFENLPRGVRISRITHEWRFAWIQKRDCVVVYRIGHHTDFWKSES